MIILGIDPGYAIVGYGALAAKNGVFRSLCYGAVTTDASDNFSKRISIIYDSMKEILEKINVDALAIEKLYFQNNQKTAICVAEARGVILLSAQKARVPVFEYTPLQVKTAVTGYGKAKKPQVMQMTKRLLNLKEMPKFDDTADALAIAICHAQTSGARFCATMIGGRSKTNVL
ncbi:MAG: Crossover junction endodeoxyribonuclease RuvC [Eubacteriales bacterium SKADARSKE-1]|nr:Crossover junction endodeoxyribonuclease RuvC [Eubacteriales bacterium SKADARSKE-1]